MKTFEIEFSGRKAGALGVRHDNKVRVEAESREAAILKLYDNYEHIMVDKITEYGPLEQAK